MSLKRSNFPIVSLNEPIILIGPGTGVAPMRSFVMDRFYHKSKSTQGASINGGGSTGDVSQHVPELGNGVFQLLNPDEFDLNTLLIFGNRKRSCDFLYESDWQSTGIKCLVSIPKTEISNIISSSESSSCVEDSHSAMNSSSIKVIAAFSQDQKEKYYVTHVIEEHGALVWRLLNEVNSCKTTTQIM